MSEAIDFITLRGEYVSLFLTAGTLAFVAGRVARLVQLPRSEVGDLFWNAGIAFVIVGRLGYLALEAPDSLTDPLVLIRLQGGLAPLLGVLAAVAVVAWRTRAERGLSTTRLAWLAVAAAGFVTAVWTYDVACLARDACYGTTAPAPLGFAMSGLSDTRMATPLLEATFLLLAAGALLTSKLSATQSLLTLGAVAALLRAALTPASVQGFDAVGLETVGFVAVALALLALATRSDPEAQSAAPRERLSDEA